MKRIVVFSKKFATELIDLGYKCIGTEINIKCPKYKVFIFEYSDELQNIINKHTK